MNDITELAKVQQEAKLLRGLRHKSIVAYEDEFLHTVTKGISTEILDYCLLMEYCENGDLTDYIRHVK